MSRSALRRIVEAFFQRWPFYVMLFVLAMALGLLQTSRGTDQYVSHGSILTKGDSLVTTQSGLGNDPVYNFLSASQFTSQELVGLVFTEVFMESAAIGAEVVLPDDAANRAFTLQALRESLSIWSSSDSIVHVTSTTDDPELSAKLVASVMEEYLVFKRVVDEDEAGSSETFFNELAEPYRLELVEAKAALDAALEEVDPDVGPTAIQASEIDRLTEVERAADSRYQEAIVSGEQARLVELQARTDVEQRYSVLDVPQVSNTPIGRRLDDVLVLAMFAVVGLLLTIAGPVFAALSNEVLMFADDIDPALGVGVVAELPRFRQRQLDPSRAGRDPLDEPIEPALEVGADDDLVAAIAGDRYGRSGSGS